MPKVKDSAVQCDGDSLRPVPRAELTEDVLNMRFDCARGRAKPVADFLIAEAVGDMDQDFGLAGGQRDFREVFNQLLGYLRGDVALTRLHYPNGMDEIGVNDLFKKISSNTGFERTIHILVS